MPENSFLPEQLREQLREIGGADILVGVPSYNNARTIGHVIRAIQAGFARYFPEQRTVIINSDGGSKDGTQEAVAGASAPDSRTILAAHPLRTVHKIVTPYHGLPGKGSALRLVFGAARELGVRACAVVDSDLRSITPEWIDLLISPIFKQDFDFVSPLYHRHKYDGTITNSIVYPITRALYGKRVRQPIGGDFGFSGRLADTYLGYDVWSSDVARFGIDIWMTTTAITGGFRVCQSFLGAKIHDVKDPGVDLSAMLTQVVSAVFQQMETHTAEWRRSAGSAAIPAFGFEYTVGLEPVTVNVERMIAIFTAGLADLIGVWEMALDPETLTGIRGLAGGSAPSFRYPTRLWVRTVYDFALAHHKGLLNREHLLKSLTPLYLGRTASFVLETAAADAEEVEAILEELCLEYERSKSYLLERWDSSKEVRP